MLKRILTAIFFTVGLAGVTIFTFRGVVYFTVKIRLTEEEVKKQEDAFYDLSPYERAVIRHRKAIRTYLSFLYYFIYWCILIYTYRRLRKEEELIKKAKESR